MTFADELAAHAHDRLTEIIDAGRDARGAADARALLQVALVNEISVASSRHPGSAPRPSST